VNGHKTCGQNLYWGNGGDPDSHTPAHESIITVAPFRAWRSSLSIVAEGPPGAPQQSYLRYERRVLCFKAGDAASGDLKYALTVMLPAIPRFVIRSYLRDQARNLHQK
jgi:hypothetical protein